MSIIGKIKSIIGWCLVISTLPKNRMFSNLQEVHKEQVHYISSYFAMPECYFTNCTNIL